jgi:hypothetical protein
MKLTAALNIFELGMARVFSTLQRCQSLRERRMRTQAGLIAPALHTAARSTHAIGLLLVEQAGGDPNA